MQTQQMWCQLWHQQQMSQRMGQLQLVASPWHWEEQQSQQRQQRQSLNQSHCQQHL
jgi:hypothetical protein